MLDILNLFSGIISANYLFQPMLLSNPINASSGLFKVVLYRSAFLCHENASVTIGGLCFAGDQEVECSFLDLGEQTMCVSPHTTSWSKLIIVGDFCRG